MIVTLFWLYRGLRRGLYPALNIFLVFFLALLVTLNYYGLAFSLVGKIAPTIDLKMRECISFAAMYFIAFGVFLYVCLWLCAENMKIHNIADAVGGGIFGLLGGVMCSGALMMFWFSTPFSLVFPVDDNEMFYPTHKMSLSMATFVGKRMPGGRAFSGVRFLRDIRHGLPGIPALGDGFYVASVPNGLRVFLSTSGDSAAAIVEVAKYLGRQGETMPPSEKKRVGDSGRTPVFIESSGDTATIVIVDDRRRTSDIPDEFAPDGAAGVATKKSLDHEIVIRVYEVEKTGNVGSVIALFQPKDVWKDVDKVTRALQDLLPSRECYMFDESKLLTELMEAGAPDTDARKLVPILRHGGKVCFAGAGNTLKCAEVLGEGKHRVFTPDLPEDLDAPVKKRKGGGR